MHRPPRVLTLVRPVLMQSANRFELEAPSLIDGVELRINQRVRLGPHPIGLEAHRFFDLVERSCRRVTHSS